LAISHEILAKLFFGELGVKGFDLLHLFKLSYLDEAAGNCIFSHSHSSLAHAMGVLIFYVIDWDDAIGNVIL